MWIKGQEKSKCRSSTNNRKYIFREIMLQEEAFLEKLYVIAWQELWMVGTRNMWLQFRNPMIGNCRTLSYYWKFLLDAWVVWLKRYKTYLRAIWALPFRRDKLSWNRNASPMATHLISTKLFEGFCIRKRF